MTLFLKSKQTKCLVTLLIMIVSTIVKSVDWNYDMDSRYGPLHWQDDFPLCGGNTQSPINILKKNAKCNPTKCHTFYWDEKPDKKQFLLSHNSHSLEIIPIDTRYRNDTNLYYLTNKYNTIAKFTNQFQNNSREHKKYCLHSVHFHWGANNSVGSEHKINGKYYAFEAHFVHYSCDYYNLQEALNNMNNATDKYILGVIGVLYKIGKANTGLDYLIKNQTISQLIIPGSRYEIEIDTYDDKNKLINIFDYILPKHKNFYHYKGSLTTPPCYPIVNWHVLSDIMTISKEQLTYFRNMMDLSYEPLNRNWRPVQNNANQLLSCVAGFSNPAIKD